MTCLTTASEEKAELEGRAAADGLEIAAEDLLTGALA